MEKYIYDEMIYNLNQIQSELDLDTKNIYLFGHCGATLDLLDILLKRKFKVVAILDNNTAKQGMICSEVPVVEPAHIMNNNSEQQKAIVLITSRFYMSMVQQLLSLGYSGLIRKVIDYNSYADYSLSDETILRMEKREKYGEKMLNALSDKYAGYFKVFCPFNALGDIYFMMSYWSAFANKRSIEKQKDTPELEKVVFIVVSKVLVQVIHLFGDYEVETYPQKDVDAMIQAVLFLKDNTSFVAHQDRPYVVNLSKALYVKKIPFKKIYCCGVYGLPENTEATVPDSKVEITKYIEKISLGKSVIFSPYAKSVVALNPSIWEKAVEYYRSMGYTCFTNVVGNEQPLAGTEAISPLITEMIPVVERAGLFIGIRSGLCDVISEAKAKKIALYPDYYYCDTKWKAIDIYWIDQFDYNLLATEEIAWEKL